MTKFYLPARALPMWLHQNRAEETGDWFPGSLLDNMCCFCKNGFAAIYEHYVNEWTSNYYVEFTRDADERDEIREEFIKNMYLV